MNKPSSAPRSDRKRHLSPAKQLLLKQRLRGESTGTSTLLQIAQSPRPARVPASDGQQRLWFIDRLEGNSAQYNITKVLRLHGPLDDDAVRHAIQTIVARHEVLRTRFVEIDGEPRQVIEDDVRVDVPAADLRGMDEADRTRRIEQELRQEESLPFDLTHGPVIRTKLLTIADDAHVLVRTIHHIACDEWSEAVFAQEFNALYDGYRSGDNPLAPLSVQYADYAIWQKGRLTDAALTALIAYWTRQLAGIPAILELPADRPRPAVQTFAGEVHRTILSRERAAAVQKLCEEHHATLYMGLLAVFGVLLSRYTGRDDVVVGCPIANRQDAHLEKLIGFFASTVVLRLRVSAHQRFCDLLAQVRQTALEAYEHQDLPFERLVEVLSPPRRFDTTRSSRCCLRCSPLRIRGRRQSNRSGS